MNQSSLVLNQAKSHSSRHQKEIDEGYEQVDMNILIQKQNLEKRLKERS